MNVPAFIMKLRIFQFNKKLNISIQTLITRYLLKNSEANKNIRNIENSRAVYFKRHFCYDKAVLL